MEKRLDLAWWWQRFRRRCSGSPGERDRRFSTLRPWFCWLKVNIFPCLQLEIDVVGRWSRSYSNRFITAMWYRVWRRLFHYLGTGRPRWLAPEIGNFWSVRGPLCRTRTRPANVRLSSVRKPVRTDSVQSTFDRGIRSRVGNSRQPAAVSDATNIFVLLVDDLPLSQSISNTHKD